MSSAKILGVAFCCAVLAGCGQDTGSNDNKKTTQDASGVFLVGCEGHAELRNQTGHEVWIRHVWQFNGETTLSMSKLPAQQAVPVDTEFQDGYYITDTEGRPLGFLSGGCTHSG